MRDIKKRIITKRDRAGFNRFYIGGKDITDKWMWFFSGLSAEQEKDCVRLFFKKVNL